MGINSGFKGLIAFIIILRCTDLRTSRLHSVFAVHRKL